MAAGLRALRLRAAAIGLGVLAGTLLLVGLYAPAAIREELHRRVVDSIVWRPDSPPPVDARFRGLPDPEGTPDYFRVWLFNITNVDAMRQKGAKPVLQEVGPLTYIKQRLKVEAKWDRTGRVAIKEWDYHTFVPELSAASPYDNITTLNLPLLGVLELAHAYAAGAPALRPLLDVLVGVLSGWRDDHVDGLFIRRTAGDLLWGYEDVLLQRLMVLLGPALVKSTTVQLLHNDTLEAVLAAPYNVIDTGWRPAGGGGGGGGGGSGAAPGGRRGGWGFRDDWRSRFDQSQIWNMVEEAGWTNVSSWGPDCTEQVTGTDAFQFPPGLTRESKLTVWITELYRSAALQYERDASLHGVRLLRFVPDPAEGEVDACHYQRVRGLANVTTPTAVGPNGNASAEAAHGVPLLVSLPHYCQVDASVAEALEGVACDPQLHSTFLDGEPVTGATLRAAKRLQLSSQLTDSARATLEPRIASPLILPVFWAEEASEASEAQARRFKSAVYGAQRWASALHAWALPGACVVAAAAAGLVAMAVVAAAGGAAGPGVASAAPPAATGQGGGSEGGTRPVRGRAATAAAPAVTAAAGDIGHGGGGGGGSEGVDGTLQEPLLPAAATRGDADGDAS